MSIIEKIISGLREIYALNAVNEETNAIIETFDKELEEIGSSVDSVILSAEQHLQERIDNGEDESILSSLKSSAQSLADSRQSFKLEQKQKEAKEAAERLVQMECEQKQKEQEMEKIMAEFQLTKQRTDEARRVAELNKSRAEEAERESNLSDNDTVRNFLKNQRPEESSELPIEDSRAQSFAQIRLKGVDLPKFSGEDTNDYEPWKAAFMSVVDRLNIPVGEKMLRLISSLSGKALTLVKLKIWDTPRVHTKRRKRN